MLSKWLDIEGWLFEEEGSKLQQLALDKTVLEIGSYLGRSTIAMAATAKKVVAVDSHQNLPSNLSLKPVPILPNGCQDTLDVFLENVKEFDNIVPMIGRSEDIIPMLSRDYDMVFIDGSHDKESVITDTMNSINVLKQGGILAWHDVHQSGVQDALESLGLTYTERVQHLGWMTL